MMENPTIVIAGASGYIGKEIIPPLLAKFPRATIIALSRSEQKSTDDRVQWKACDLFSLRSLEAALPSRVDCALYLVHSMGPTAQLDQGSFADYDLILADNFSRAVRKTGIQQLIYLGGLIPDVPHLSRHLQSRLEVEQVFRGHDLPTTIFRAGLILGEAGSSFQILTKLVKRLPVMICPRWTQTLTTPVDLATVLTAITSVAASTGHIGKTYDLRGCEPLTYVEMMRLTARAMGLKRFFLSVPFFTPTLSGLWVSLITNSPRSLVDPLIESLEHPMLARDAHLFSQPGIHRSYPELLPKTFSGFKSGQSFFRFRARRRTVRSVQRLPLPHGKDAKWMKDQYLVWLPKFLATFVTVRQENGTTIFSLFRTRLSLLEMSLSEERSDNDRQLLYVTKGLLVSKKNRGRLEFRVALDRRFVIAAIHDFRPALPWYIYKYTQAKLHLMVMMAFARHLKKISALPRKT